MLWTPRTTTEVVLAEIVHDLFDRPVMSAYARTVFARHLVLAGLGDGFRRSATADLERVDGRTLAVRQAAALDADPFAAVRPATFAIDDLAGREADVLILAWHGVANRAIVDQRDPAQWAFAALPIARLPHARTLAWDALDSLGATAIRFAALRDETRRTLAILHRVPPDPQLSHASL